MKILDHSSGAQLQATVNDKIKMLGVYVDNFCEIVQLNLASEGFRRDSVTESRKLRQRAKLQIENAVYLFIPRAANPHLLTLSSAGHFHNLCWT